MMVKTKATTSIEKAGAAQPTTNSPVATQVDAVIVEKTNASTQKRTAELLNLMIIFPIVLIQAPMLSYVASTFTGDRLSLKRATLQTL